MRKNKYKDPKWNIKIIYMHNEKGKLNINRNVFEW